MDVEHVPGILTVLIGGGIAVSVHYLIGRYRDYAGQKAQLTTEGGKILRLSEGLQRTIREEQHETSEAAGVQEWDLRTYRLALLRLRGFGPSPELLAALSELEEARLELKMAWRLSRESPGGAADLASALEAHTSAIETFATACSILVRLSWPLSRPPEAA